MRGRFHGDLDQVIDRFAAEDLLAVDDVDRMTRHSEAAAALLELLERRRKCQRCSLLTVATHLGAMQAHPLVDFLGCQPAVGLALTKWSK